MEYTVIKINADGTIEAIPFATEILGADYLEWMQKMVGGYIEDICPRGLKKAGVRMLVNEDGKSLHLPVNEIASYLYNHENIVGDVLLVVTDINVEDYLTFDEYGKKSVLEDLEVIKKELQKM